MRLLLDTHVLFWWMAQDERLDPRHRALIEDDGNEIYISAVPGWEISIKVKLGNWPEAEPLLPDLTSKIVAAGFEILPLTLPQAERAGQLELSNRDPFDRMLAAQAVDLGIGLVTSDRALSMLGCSIV